MDFKKYLEKSAREIDEVLNLFLNLWLEEVEKTSNKLIPLAKVLVDSCQGGKRLRSSLVKMGYSLGGGEGNEILKPAAAVEILQSSFLIHDDIIDRSPTRRGKPTVYHVLGGDHYGISQAIVLADLGFFLGFKMINESTFPDELKLKAIKIYVDRIIDTAAGQSLELALPKSENSTEEDSLLVYKLKTARYTVSGPLELGVALAGGDEKLITSIGHFGDNLGIAFQIQDDLLDIFGDKETLGKEPGADIKEGVLNILYLKTKEMVEINQGEFLRKYYGTADLTEQEIEEIKRIFISTGAVDYANKLAQEYAKKAKEIIPSLTKDQYQIRLLTQMADFAVERNK